MRLGFWNRLAIVVGMLALVIVPTGIWFDMVKDHHESRDLSLELCQTIAKGYLDREEYQRYHSENQKCWDERFNGPDTSPGWPAWRELAGGTAVALIVLYLLIWGAVATVKWVWRGRDVGKQSPASIEVLLAGRRYEDLSDDEKAVYLQLREAGAERQAQAFADNLNRNVLSKDGRGAGDGKDAK